MVSEMKIFIGGSKNISKLDSETKSALDRLCTENANILIGDCFGADTLVQQYLNDKGYRNVTVYVSGDKARNNIGGFNEKHINADGLTGFKFYRQKDIAMVKDADCGLMLWDEKTKGTAYNIRDMREIGKEVIIIIYG